MTFGPKYSKSFNGRAEVRMRVECHFWKFKKKLKTERQFERGTVTSVVWFLRFNRNFLVEKKNGRVRPNFPRFVAIDRRLIPNHRRIIITVISGSQKMRKLASLSPLQFGQFLKKNYPTLMATSVRCKSVKCKSFGEEANWSDCDQVVTGWRCPIIFRLKPPGPHKSRVPHF